MLPLVFDFRLKHAHAKSSRPDTQTGTGVGEVFDSTDIVSAAISNRLSIG